jgi:hypothetical protein
VLVVEDAVPHWGIIKSMEIGVSRDDCVVNDINTRNIGLKDVDGKLWLKFQLHDPTTPNVKNHGYKVDATINFFSFN